MQIWRKVFFSQKALRRLGAEFESKFYFHKMEVPAQKRLRRLEDAEISKVPNLEANGPDYDCTYRSKRKSRARSSGTPVNLLRMISAAIRLNVVPFPA